MIKAALRTHLVLAALAVSGTANAETLQVEVDKETCQKVQRHLARADVNYKPGVDARGNPVVPADTVGGQIKIPDQIIVDLALPLKDLFAEDNAPNRSLQNADVSIGKLTYDIKTGRLDFNGQELGNPALVKIGEKCYEVYDGKSE
ncbi:hypothetical protein [Sneathiella limimaris]|uniref:hypothetical protein n=1 Tax=Sneathiella limimaris TaxID=1964213 RepID=UPI00146DD951|nr:hypothetical protein [Sneathiella limimaris]